MPLPKVYRGPSPSADENIEDKIDSCALASLPNVRNAVHADSNSLTSSSVLVSDLPEKSLTDLQARKDNLPAADNSDADDSVLENTAVPMHNHRGEGITGPVVQNHSSAVESLSECETVENIKLAKQHSGDAGADHAACKRCKDLDSDRPAVENPTSAPISIPGSDTSAIVNGGNSTSRQRLLGSISEDLKPLTPSTSDDVGTGSSAQLPSFYEMRRRSLMSNPRFTPAGSFIIPADEDIYVDYSCGLFSTEECDAGRVLDVSTLPSPPHRPFTVGDHNDDTDNLSYYSPNESIASALTQSCQSFRSRETSVDTDSTRHHSDSEINKHDSTDVRVEMIDATSRDVLDEIFKRTSGTFAFFFYCISTYGK